ncbi:hypothetical protein KAT51_00575 [bacterium]|nr:hypothetical protein [bacterium]
MKKKTDWQRKYLVEKKAHKKTKAKLKWKEREESATYKAFKLRKKGMPWKKIAKRVEVPESTLRLATQKRFTRSGMTNTWLRGKWTKDKEHASNRMDMNTRAYIDKQTTRLMGKYEDEFLEKAMSDQHLHSYEEYVRQKY